ncbi:copper transporter [Brachybacterium fresconis]|uniref:Outer membrane murein-binding lipoprotein Lpp n=1 Tax=Brachybacterium fresconis TaxID=173363 RepID=A0ABS4YEE7_9MICO|nr:outer membrane murein-binding lipoprotein Lpp [Brachybacterium fresconis]
MIDFRYHLVSLISVFLALAVGIVLGAGPLRESLGDQLAGQVEQLRSEQDRLRTEADELASRNDQLASFVSDIGPELVADTMPGARVAILTDDSSTRSDTDRISALLEEAGVASTIRVDLKPSLWEPGQEQKRAESVEQIRAIAPGLLQDGLDDSAQLSAVVGALLTPSATGELTEELRTQVWQVLTGHQMVALDGEMPAAVDGVVVAGAAPEQFTDESEEEDAAAERAQSLLTTRTALLTTLSESGVPAVVSAATPHNDASTGILRTVRGDGAFDALSTTDRLQEADGPLLAVLALIEQARGGQGAYGTTADADDRLPELPETRGLEDATGGDGTGQGGGTGGDGQGTGAQSVPSDGGGAQ